MRLERVRAAAILLGIGLGGFLDGIVLHQILHWHQMVSVLADGLFHLVMWVATLAGVLILWSALRAPGRMPSTRTLCGYMMVGWGSFNLVEGIVDHHLLELHHVRDLPTHIPFYDWAFLIIGGVALILIGLALRDGKDRAPADIAERRRGQERRMAYR